MNHRRRSPPTADTTIIDSTVPCPHRHHPDEHPLVNLPTRPTKRTDTRAAGFVGESVEVDAIPASELRRIVREAIERHVDTDQLVITRMVEQSEREGLRAMANGWSA